MNILNSAALLSALLASAVASHNSLPGRREDSIMGHCYRANLSGLRDDLFYAKKEAGAQAVCFSFSHWFNMGSGPSCPAPSHLDGMNPYDALFTGLEEHPSNTVAVADCLTAMLKAGVPVECPGQAGTILNRIRNGKLGADVFILAVQKGAAVSNYDFYDTIRNIPDNQQEGMAILQALLASEQGKRVLADEDNPLGGLAGPSYEDLGHVLGNQLIDLFIENGAAITKSVIAEWVNSLVYGDLDRAAGCDHFLKAIPNPFALYDGKTIDDVIDFYFEMAIQEMGSNAGVIQADVKRALQKSLEEARAVKPVPVDDNGEPFTIQYKGNGSEVNVYVTGNFDGWKKTVKMTKSATPGHFEKEFIINRNGNMQFKFVVDGDWRVSPDYPTKDDGHNNINNVL